MLSQSSREIRQRFMQEFSKEILIQVSKKLPQEIITSRSIESLIQKIEEILKEEGVEAVECPSPDRYLIVKKNNKLKVLNIMLEEIEIEEIINYYFKKSGRQFFNPFSIPFAGGRMVGLLSQKVGSRFILYKK